jgi:hypothetical protein
VKYISTSLSSVVREGNGVCDSALVDWNERVGEGILISGGEVGGCRAEDGSLAADLVDLRCDDGLGGCEGRKISGCIDVVAFVLGGPVARTGAGGRLEVGGSRANAAAAWTSCLSNGS